MTNAIDRESRSRGSLGSAPAVVETRNGSRACTLFPLPYGKNFRVDCLVFRISERPRFRSRPVRITYRSRFIDTTPWWRTETRKSVTLSMTSTSCVNPLYWPDLIFAWVKNAGFRSTTSDANIYLVITLLYRYRVLYVLNVLWLLTLWMYACLWIYRNVLDNTLVEISLWNLHCWLCGEFKIISNCCITLWLYEENSAYGSIFLNYLFKL